MVYCQSIFERGSGFGNRLFPWARCRIFAAKNKVRLLAPKWFQPRIGPLRRGGIDLKYYIYQILLLDLFKDRMGDLTGIGRTVAQLSSRKVSEPDGSILRDRRVPSSNVIFVFRGDKNHFSDLHGWDQFLINELRAITKQKWLDLVDRIGDIPVGINVRLGNDFRKAASGQEYFTNGAIKTPINWFMES